MQRIQLQVVSLSLNITAPVSCIVQETEFLNLLGVFIVCSAGFGIYDPVSWFSKVVILVSLLSIFHPLLHADNCFCFDILSNYLRKLSMSFCRSGYLALTFSGPNLSVSMSFTGAHPFWKRSPLKQNLPNQDHEMVLRFTSFFERVVGYDIAYIYLFREEYLHHHSQWEPFILGGMHAIIHRELLAFHHTANLLSCSDSVGWPCEIEKNKKKKRQEISSNI